MTIPNKRPCPCGCPKFLLDGLCGCQCSTKTSEEADAIIEVYKDAERFRFLIANPALCSVLQFQLALKRREWIDERMKDPHPGKGRKKPK